MRRHGEDVDALGFEHANDFARGIALSPDHAGVQVQRPHTLLVGAQALRALDRIDEARIAFTQSRDEDICPLRALTPIREIVTNVARTKKTGFVDFVGVVNEHSPNRIPGSELFLDHVHPTIEGNRLLALAIVQEMLQEGIVSQAETWNEDLIAEISSELKDGLDEKTHAIALRNLSRVLTWAGKHDEAERLVNLAVAMIPEDSETHIQKGLLLWRAGDREAALAHYRECTP